MCWCGKAFVQCAWLASEVWPAASRVRQTPGALQQLPSPLVAPGEHVRLRTTPQSLQRLWSDPAHHAIGAPRTLLREHQGSTRHDSVIAAPRSHRARLAAQEGLDRLARARGTVSIKDILHHLRRYTPGLPSVRSHRHVTPESRLQRELTSRVDLHHRDPVTRGDELGRLAR